MWLKQDLLSVKSCKQPASLCLPMDVDLRQSRLNDEFHCFDEVEECVPQAGGRRVKKILWAIFMIR